MTVPAPCPEDTNARIPACTSRGYTLVELIVVVSLVGILAATAVQTFRCYHESCCLKAAVFEICAMIREVKVSAMDAARYSAIGFDSGQGRVSLIADRGSDGTWNTSDDKVDRTLLLSSKGGGLRFGYGSHGPLPTLAEAPDGISFQSNNTLVCNPDLTGSAGTVYLISRSGVAMAIVMNSKDFGYVLWRWSGKKWLKF